MTIKKCKLCGGKYKVEDTEIKLRINHMDIEALEDIFFCDLTEEGFKKILPNISKVWKQLCNQEKSQKLFEGDN